MATFASYAADFSDDFANEHFARLDHILSVELAEAPLMWRCFYGTSAPYRACLFRVGRCTQFWIVCTVDEAQKLVSVLRLWNASVNPTAFRD